MPNFLYIYHGGHVPETEDEVETAMAAWGKWMTNNGSSLVDAGNPVGMSKTVSSAGVANDGGSNPVMGYTIVSAPDIEAACRMAASNPSVAEGGSVEVAEIIEIEM